MFSFRIILLLMLSHCYDLLGHMKGTLSVFVSSLFFLRLLTFKIPAVKRPFINESRVMSIDKTTWHSATHHTLIC